MSKIESGKLSVSESEFNLAELVENVLLALQPLLKQKKHTLHVHLKDVVHEDIIGDPLRLQQIFTNLMSNAIKYTPEAGLLISAYWKSMTSPSRIVHSSLPSKTTEWV